MFSIPSLTCQYTPDLWEQHETSDSISFASVGKYHGGSLSCFQRGAPLISQVWGLFHCPSSEFWIEGKKCKGFVVPEGATKLPWAGFPGVVLESLIPVAGPGHIIRRAGPQALLLLSSFLSSSLGLTAGNFCLFLPIHSPPFSSTPMSWHWPLCPLVSGCLASEGVWAPQNCEGRALFTRLPLRKAISAWPPLKAKAAFRGPFWDPASALSPQPASRFLAPSSALLLQFPQTLYAPLKLVPLLNSPQIAQLEGTVCFLKGPGPTCSWEQLQPWEAGTRGASWPITAGYSYGPWASNSISLINW